METIREIMNFLREFYFPLLVGSAVWVLYQVGGAFAAIKSLFEAKAALAVATTDQVEAVTARDYQARR